MCTFIFIRWWLISSPFLIIINKFKVMVNAIEDIDRKLSELYKSQGDCLIKRDFFEINSESFNVFATINESLHYQIEKLEEIKSYLKTFL